jgi:hypothetical protein
VNPCPKKDYGTEAAAGAALRAYAGRVGVRTYRCGCGGWHTTSQPRLPWRRDHRGLAPVRTLEEVQAIAAEKRAAYGA